MLLAVNLGCSFITLRRAIINDLDVILYGLMLQILYTKIFRVKRLSNRTVRVRIV
jgi:hypothetical protein